MNHYVDDILNEKIEKIKTNNNVYETGHVVRVQDYIIEVKGLENVSFFEQVNIGKKAIGYVNAILSNSVIIAIIKQIEPILVSDMVVATGEEYQILYSTESFGRIIDIFGKDQLTGKTFSHLVKLPIETKTIPIMDRSKVKRPLLTGIAGIDLIYPIGRGQRQLIIGDKKTGKTQICLDTIVNQTGKNMLCIYVAIGKTKKEIKEIYNELFKRNAMSYTIIITALNDEKPSVLTLTPYAALAIAEVYMKQRYDVLVVMDDLKRHADAYRELSLMIGKAPGRDAYPADIFYTHSRLLEKGCQHKNGGSITVLPIIETKGGDITDYISTNVISITDGQIVLSNKMFQRGQKPAIDYSMSVSRLGGDVQNPNTKTLGAVVKRQLLNYLETKDIYELANVDEMNEELKHKMVIGKDIVANLSQYKYKPLSEQEILQKFHFVQEGYHEY